MLISFLLFIYFASAHLFSEFHIYKDQKAKEQYCQSIVQTQLSHNQEYNPHSYKILSSPGPSVFSQGFTCSSPSTCVIDLCSYCACVQLHHLHLIVYSDFYHLSLNALIFSLICSSLCLLAYQIRQHLVGCLIDYTQSWLRVWHSRCDYDSQVSEFVSSSWILRSLENLFLVYQTSLPMVT